MKKGLQFVQFRRKREGKTDYRYRWNLLKSRERRLVVRKSNKHIIAQIVEYSPEGDKVLVSAHTSDLKKFGWDLTTSNLPAAYLTGILCGLKAKQKKIKKAILDMGLYHSTKGSKLYAVLKGAIDAGLEIPHSDSNFPADDRIKGKPIDSYRKTNISSAVDKTKKKILDSLNENGKRGE